MNRQMIESIARAESLRDSATSTEQYLRYNARAERLYEQFAPTPDEQRAIEASRQKRLDIYQREQEGR